jgi:hypothetical protein
VALPKHNIFFRDIPKSACVIDRGKWYEARIGRKRYLVNWDSQNAVAAQHTLAQRAKKGCKK